MYQYLLGHPLHRWPEYSPPENSTTVISPPEHSPHEKYTWKQRCLALREIFRWREPFPTRFLDPNASEASYKPEQRRERTFLGGMYIVQGRNVPEVNFPGRSEPRTELMYNKILFRKVYLSVVIGASRTS